MSHIISSAEVDTYGTGVDGIESRTMSHIITSAEPPETPVRRGLTPIRMRMYIVELLMLASEAQGECLDELSGLAQRTALALQERLAASEPDDMPTPVTTPNTGV